jgi:hypothetical protein
MRWDEVTAAYTSGKALIIRGNGQALGFNSLLADKNSGRMYAYVQEQLAARNIAIEPVKKLPPGLSKELRNTKVR